MPTFFYQAVDRHGKKVTGKLEAATSEAAMGIIFSRGESPVVVRPQRFWDLSMNGADLMQQLRAVKPDELIMFTKQMSTLIRAGVSMLQVLDTLENQSENPRLKRIVAGMSMDVRQGSTLSDALSKHPRIFSPLYCSMVRAGESSGSLPQVLERLIYIIQHEYKIRMSIRAALQYPALVFGCLLVAFFVLLTGVIPRFARIFARANIALPLPTRICLELNRILMVSWPWLLFGAAATALALAWAFSTDRGRFVRDTIMLRLPAIGPVLTKAAISRFSSIFAILQASGIPVLESMHILAGTIGNHAVARELVNVGHLLEQGRGIADPLRNAKYFTPLVINMVAIGEESGQLDEMLREVSSHYDVEVEYATKKMSDAIGPALVICLSFLVGFFALAIYMPMWDLTKLVK